VAPFGGGTLSVLEQVESVFVVSPRAGCH
jgi:hypothetical protein